MQNKKRLFIASVCTIAMSFGVVVLASTKGKVAFSTTGPVQDTLTFSKANCVSTESSGIYINTTTATTRSGTMYDAISVSDISLDGVEGIAVLENSNYLKFHHHGGAEAYFQDVNTVTLNFTNTSEGTLELTGYIDTQNNYKSYYQITPSNLPLVINGDQYRRFDFACRSGSIEVTSVTFDYNCAQEYDDPLESSENILSGIEITNKAAKRDYRVGEIADYTGLEVTAHFTQDDDHVIANENLQFEGFSTATTGKKTVTVSYTYQGTTKTTSFPIKVFDGNNVVLDFYGFNDTHGNVLDSSLGVGIARTTTYMKQVTQGQNALLISSGDMWQGSLESNSNRGALMTQWMQQLDFTSMTIGNHEFDWGTDVIRANSQNYSLPILGINIIDKTTGQRADYVQPSTIVYRGGAKIGIIGAIGDCYSSISYSKVMDVEFVLDREGEATTPLTDLIKAESTRLRNEENCDFIVYSFHGDSIHNNTYYNTELSTGGYVDLVFEGHKHLETYYLDAGNVWHFQSSADNQLTFNHVSVALDTSTDQFSVYFDPENDIHNMTSAEATSVAEDPETLKLIYQYDFSEYYKPLGVNSVTRGGDTLRQLNADLYLEKALDKWSQYADQIVLGGGYISVRGDRTLPAGDVTYAQFYTLFPFDNDILLMQVTGSILKSNFINSTNSNYFLSYTSYGSGLRDDQTQILDDALYYVVSDTYTYDYLLKYNDPIDCGHYSTDGYYARDCLADFARAGGFNTGETPVDPVVIVNDGTFARPYTIEEALALAGDTATWAYVKGVVANDSFSLVGNYFQDVVLADANNAEKTMTAYRIHRFDDDSVYGFTNKNELPVGSEVLMFGSFYLRNGNPQFGSVNVCITIDGQAPAGDSPSNPISVVNFKECMEIGLWQGLYVFGTVGNVVRDGDTLTQATIVGDHNVDYNYNRMEAYDTELTSYPGMTFTYADGVDPNDAQQGAKVIAQINATTIHIVYLEYTEPDPPSTMENPYSIAKAVSVAVEHGSNSGDAPYIFARGVVCQKASQRSSTTGDLQYVHLRDLTTLDEITIYWLKKSEGSTVDTGFQSIDDLPIGTIVTVYGKVYTYNSSPQFGGGTFCVSIDIPA